MNANKQKVIGLKDYLGSRDNMDKNTKHKKIILVTRTGSMTYPQLSINDVLALNEGRYEERYMLAKIDCEYQVIWNYEDEAYEEITLEQYLRENAIRFTKQFGIESYNAHRLFPRLGGDSLRHTGNNTFVISLNDGEEIVIQETIKDESKEYSTQSEYLDVEGVTRTFTHRFTSMKALFGYIDKILER